MTEKVNPDTTDPAHRFFKLEGSRWFSIFTVLGATFLSAITITNWARSLFDFELLPYFEPSFDAILAWSHWVLDLVIFRWAEAIGEVVLNGIAGALRSWFHVPIPNLDLSIPGWWKDASLVSFLLLRSQNASKRLSLPISPLLMSDVERKEWDNDRATVGRLGGALERVLWGLVVAVFGFSDAVAWPIKKVLGKSAGKLIRDTVGGTLLLGVLYLAHDVVLGFNTRKSQSSQAEAHRRFVLLMSVSLFAAVVASMAFLFVNGAFAKAPMTG